MVSLNKVLELNKWWTKGGEFANEDYDLLSYRNSIIKLQRKELLPLLKPGSIVIIKGPRRVGKTVAIKLTIEKLISEMRISPDDIFYFSFDETISQKEFENLLRDFLSKVHSGSTYIFLDEIQAVRGWQNTLLALANSGALADTAVLVTGSIAHFLGTETLPGRGTEGNIYYLRTSSFRDFVISVLNNFHSNTSALSYLLGYNFSPSEPADMLETLSNTFVSLEEDLREAHKSYLAIQKYFIPLSKMFDLYLLSGGYPKSISYILDRSEPKPPSTFYEEIYNYIKNDAATITSPVSGDPAKASKTISAVLDLVGNKISYSKIAQKMAMNKATTINYLHRLENSFVFIELNGVKSFKNELREISAKKFYFSDIFMHYSAGAAQTGKPGSEYTKELVNSSNVGMLVEEIVAGHLIRVKESDPMKLYSTYIKFYEGSREIDFIYKKDSGRSIGIEAKYQNEASIQDVKRVAGVDEYLLLTKSSGISIKNNTMVLPVCLFLALLSSSKHNL